MSISNSAYQNELEKLPILNGNPVRKHTKRIQTVQTLRRDKV